MAKPNVKGLNHVALYAPDPDALAEFYETILGLQIIARGKLNQEHTRSSVYLSFQSQESSCEVSIFANPDIQHTAFEVSSLTNLKMLYELILAYRLRIRWMLNHGISLAFYFYDPADNLIKLFWPTGINYPQPYSRPIDLSQPETVLRQDIEHMTINNKEVSFKYKSPTHKENIMSTMQKTISTVIKDSFSTTTIEGSGGFIQFVSATDGLTGEQAAAVPAEGLNSVWAVVLHLTVLQTALEMALRGEALPVQDTAEAAWPPIGEISDENWEQARQTALESNSRLVKTIAAIPDEQLDTILTNWFNVVTREAILTVYGHISYHTAEIVTIRHIQGLRVDHPFA